MLQTVLQTYGFQKDSLRIAPFGNGLINHTWKVTAANSEYILQRINHTIFKKPGRIEHNIKLIADYLKLHHPEYKFVVPVTTFDGNQMIYLKSEGYFRLFPFVEGSHSKEVVEAPEQAYEAALQFGRLTRMLAGFDVDKLQITIPHFHDLKLRFRQFLTALQKGNEQRISEAAELIKFLKIHSDVVTEYGRMKHHSRFRQRVTHHDTKISNVLFDTNGKSICVIDLDTVMPGYFISDVGDMMRTYLSPVSEEESDFTKIEVRNDFYQAIVSGYCKEMKDELTETERDYFLFAGKYMIYMQALRFFTDHINNDIYYGAKYPGQNFIRAKNQVVLLQCLLEKEKALTKLKCN
jgi:Ser/Thr protein kinase RdoA (MazF antagonist)